MQKEFEPGKEKDKERRIQIPITINNSSVGDAEFVYMTINGKACVHIMYGPRKDVIVNEQPLSGEITARLSVKVISEEERFFLVETSERNQKVRLKVDKESGKIIPFRYDAVLVQNIN